MLSRSICVRRYVCISGHALLVFVGLWSINANHWLRRSILMMISRVTTLSRDPRRPLWSLVCLPRQEHFIF